jgi:hypothetical protein
MSPGDELTLVLDCQVSVLTNKYAEGGMKLDHGGHLTHGMLSKATTMERTIGLHSQITCIGDVPKVRSHGLHLVALRPTITYGPPATWRFLTSSAWPTTQ